MGEKTFTAIILAAGSGKRMKSSVPKQYLDLNGYPLIYYTLLEFQNSKIDEVILVVSQEEINYCRQEIVEKYKFTKVHQVIAGGSERYYSVYEGLKAAGNPDYVLIHDGARPFADRNMIQRVMENVIRYQACVVGMPVKDTIKIADENQYACNTPDRSRVWMVQTPQAFSYNLIKDAYKKLLKEKEIQVTDDAMVVETVTSTKVKLIQGSYTNIKVTTPEDLRIAESFLQEKTMKNSN